MRVWFYRKPTILPPGFGIKKIAKIIFLDMANSESPEFNMWYHDFVKIADIIHGLEDGNPTAASSASKMHQIVRQVAFRREIIGQINELLRRQHEKGFQKDDAESLEEYRLRAGLNHVPKYRVNTEGHVISHINQQLKAIRGHLGAIRDNAIHPDMPEALGRMEKHLKVFESRIR